MWERSQSSSFHSGSRLLAAPSRRRTSSSTVRRKPADEREGGEGGRGGGGQRRGRAAGAVGLGGTRRASRPSCARSIPTSLCVDGIRSPARGRRTRPAPARSPARREARLGPVDVVRSRATAAGSPRGRTRTSPGSGSAAGRGAGPSPGRTRAPATAAPAGRAAARRPAPRRGRPPAARSSSRRTAGRRCPAAATCITALAWSAAGCSMLWYAAAIPSARRVVVGAVVQTRSSGRPRRGSSGPPGRYRQRRGSPAGSRPGSRTGAGLRQPVAPLEPLADQRPSPRPGPPR